MPNEVSVSRRRIVQGALWATPAVLIATALPAAAASPPALGAIAVAGTSGYQDASVLTVSALGVHAGTSGDHPVSSLTMVITVPNARAGSTAGTTASAGWTFVSRVVGASTTAYTYAWTGTLAAGVSTGPLVAVIPINNLRTAFTAGIQVKGTSNAIGVQSAVANVSVGAYSVLTFGAAYSVVRDAYGTTPRFIHHTATIRNNSGAPSSNTAPIVGLVVRITVPTAAIGGAGTPSVESGPWSYSSSSVSGANTIYLFTYTGGSLAASAAVITANFRTPLTGPYFTAPTITAVFEGHSPTVAGALSSVTGSDTLALFE